MCSCILTKVQHFGFINTILISIYSQGTKCEEWKDEKKKFCDSIVHSNYKLAACVHCTRYTLCRRISSSIDGSVTFIQEIFKQWKSWDSLENCRVLYENALCSTQCVVHNCSVSWKLTELFGTNKSERKVIYFLSQSFKFSEK